MQRPGRIWQPLLRQLSAVGAPVPAGRWGALWLPHRPLCHRHAKELHLCALLGQHHCIRYVKSARGNGLLSILLYEGPDLHG